MSLSVQNFLRRERYWDVPAEYEAQVKRQPLQRSENSPQQRAAVLHLQENARPAFLAALADRGTVKQACRAAGISRPTFYEWQRRDRSFAEAVGYAKEDFADDMRDLAYDVARNPADHPELVAHPNPLFFAVKSVAEEFRDTSKVELNDNRTQNMLIVGDADLETVKQLFLSQARSSRQTVEVPSDVTQLGESCSASLSDE